MTTQYIRGELSLRLSELQAVAPNPDSAREIGQLRLAAEVAPSGALPVVALRALELMRCLCGDSLARGDLIVLARQATAGAELREFASSASLLGEDQRGS